MKNPRLSPETLALLIEDASRGTDGILATDAELFEHINAKLPDIFKICYRTFQRYKAAAQQYGRQAVDSTQKFPPTYGELYHALVMNGIKQKGQLVRQMLEADGNKWHRYKWMLEKKFPELNQRCITENHRRETAHLDADYPMYQPTYRKEQAPPTPPAPTEEEYDEQPEIPATQPSAKSEVEHTATPITHQENHHQQPIEPDPYSPHYHEMHETDLVEV